MNLFRQSRWIYGPPRSCSRSSRVPLPQTLYLIWKGHDSASSLKAAATDSYIMTPFGVDRDRPALPATIISSYRLGASQQPSAESAPLLFEMFHEEDLNQSESGMKDNEASQKLLLKLRMRRDSRADRAVEVWLRRSPQMFDHHRTVEDRDSEIPRNRPVLFLSARTYTAAVCLHTNFI